MSSIRIAAVLSALLLAACGEPLHPTSPTLDGVRASFSTSSDSTTTSDTTVTAQGGTLVGGN